MPWGALGRAVNRPYRVTFPMVLLVSMVPFYLVIADRTGGGGVYAPALPLDRVLPVVPAWALVYGAVYLFLILLPIVVVQDEAGIRGTVRAYLAIWTVSYAFFLLIPTVAPRPDHVAGSGFAVWGLKSLYGADPPYNCFPSLHVAHSFVSALACRRVHRGVGRVALACASLVAISTLFTKQHWVVDVIAGMALAFAAFAIFLPRSLDAGVARPHRRVAPFLALGVGAIVGLATAGMWLFYAIRL